ncbi:MAG: hypothetical protein N2561_04655 [Bacteroidetes bacterium]|nr:hypothetical protein [Rhodothermia bacterium]MCS7154437.1 hypothetical protein [Bacteroidota bacterium]MCX7906810.1 hypothetical protein [Bacteroidota bacterium]MDW8136911.1 hypothetical protein [Bacteroidota bacterium]MDW8285219.1 hypothetical protein [Bacteroidota bacterium]
MAIEALKQFLSLSGAGCILGAFAMVQLGRWRPTQARYNWLNLIGALALLASAWIDRNWGFILLELLWSALSVWALLRKAAPAEVGS